MNRIGSNSLVAACGGAIAFLLAAVIFLFAIGKPPLTTLGQMAINPPIRIAIGTARRKC